MLQCGNYLQEGTMPLESLDTDMAAEAAQWQARVDLAAAHRLAVQHGFNEGIFNHLTAARAGDR